MSSSSRIDGLYPFGVPAVYKWRVGLVVLEERDSGVCADGRGIVGVAAAAAVIVVIVLGRVLIGVKVLRILIDLTGGNLYVNANDIHRFNGDDAYIPIPRAYEFDQIFD